MPLVFERVIPRAYMCEPRLLLERAHPELANAARAQDGHERLGALLLGPTGCGKSSVAAWLIRRWMASNSDEGPTVAWLDALEATDAERRYRLGSGDPEELVEAYSRPWLVIDDVGAIASATLIQLVLSRRYSRALPTIVTSGLTAHELTAHIGAATVRRIVEHQGQPGLFVDCHGRGAAQAKREPRG